MVAEHHNKGCRVPDWPARYVHTQSQPWLVTGEQGHWHLGQGKEASAALTAS